LFAHVRKVGTVLAISLLGFSADTLGAAPAADADGIYGFRSPTGNIGCYLSTYDAMTPMLRCDVRGGLVPLPPNPLVEKECEWGAGYRMNPTGRPRVVCAGDTALLAPNVLPYGARWTSNGITCDSERTGMRCENRSHHGFTLAKGEAHAF
jgi:hypothetical protein